MKYPVCSLALLGILFGTSRPVMGQATTQTTTQIAGKAASQGAGNSTTQLTGLSASQESGQSATGTDSLKSGFFSSTAVVPRMRVLIDNDFSGDPDGLFALVHFLLSPSVEISGIIGSHLKVADGFDPSAITATKAAQKVQEVLGMMKMQKPVFQGSNNGLESLTKPRPSAAADAIIREAMRTDTKLPLYIVCGAGLTDLASALLMKPEIASHLTLVWIGGPEYPDLALPPPNYTPLEYNLGIDIRAAQVVFNSASIPVWQVPRSSYRQVLLPYSTLILKVKSQGQIGRFLTASLENVMLKTAAFHLNLGETYIIGDSPLVLLTALQSAFESDPSSSTYVVEPAPVITDKGLYTLDSNGKMLTTGRKIRVYSVIDSRLLFDDFFSKLSLYNMN